MPETQLKKPLDAITADRLLEHIKTLSSDEFEGRKPGTDGEGKSVDYLIKQCKQLGLELGDFDGGFMQKIPVKGVRTRASMEFKHAGETLALTQAKEFVARWTGLAEEAVANTAELLFVGYGIEAPEYGWNDYKDVDVRGKILVMLIADPRRADKKSPEQFDETFFKGKALTYYGRWTYKYEIAYAKGAAGVLIIHETDRAGYGFDVVQASWGSENLFLADDDEHALLEGWLSNDAARKLCAAAGHNLDELEKAAQQPDFQPVPLRGKLEVNVETSTRRFTSCNVIGKIHGGDAKLKEECIVYCAHWDHFGKVVDDNGKTVGIYSGAADNGSGVATILEIARAYKALPEPPKRTIVFLFTTLEEYGLLGAKYYVEHPAVPLEKTLAIINCDMMNLWGRTKKFVSTAHGHSSLDAVLARHAGHQGREISIDSEPEKGYFFRSDHLEFLRKGIPALFALNPGEEYIGKPAQYGAEKRTQYLCHDYHKFNDKVKTDWDLSGLVEDAQLLFLCGLDIANGKERPQWNEQSEFKSAAQRVRV